MGQLHNRVRALVESGKSKLLINLAEVSYIDSGSLGELMGAYTTVSKAGGSLKLLRPQERTRHLLEVTQMESLFEVFQDEREALESFD